MTVEQNVLQQSPGPKHQQTFLNQLREITGINDIQILQQALKDSKGNLELAVAFLTAKNAKAPQQEETTYYQTALPSNDRYISVGSQADTNVIDLTGDDKDDLQRAIALSLEESNRAFRETGITDEEQAISSLSTVRDTLDVHLAIAVRFVRLPSNNTHLLIVGSDAA
ncbi:ubiquitin carboxyl-terminal hydrolase 25 [Tachyglossus aculeatus]|uniref:ubiquitin carboxyl-terminal hydrolase 25 n=1 Tax=Tachyglossus aculeatus TaxID=9261 RepID=UPI0018F6D9DD|nr:ubiquitin carboxyl-terminal hydrolase 25 [Tachyglossus aculeatus]